MCTSASTVRWSLKAAAARRPASSCGRDVRPEHAPKKRSKEREMKEKSWATAWPHDKRHLLVCSTPPASRKQPGLQQSESEDQPGRVRPPSESLHHITHQVWAGRRWKKWSFTFCCRGSGRSSPPLSISHCLSVKKALKTGQGLFLIRQDASCPPV